MKLIVIGNGVAGLKVAEDVKKLRPESDVSIYTDEPYGYYSRIWLPELISGNKTVKKLIMRDDDWYKAKGIEFHRGTTVSKIDVDEKRVHLDDGSTDHYDELCICTGARNFVPPFKNHDATGVFTLRTIDDALAIRDYLKGKEKAVCIGGGLLGLEAARQLQVAGLDVTVVEYFPRLLPKQLCGDSARLFEKKIIDLGMHVITGTTAEEVIVDDGGVATKVKLKNGEVIVAGLVLVSAGIRARHDLASDAGIEVNKCIVVDERMHTSADHVWAAGDAVEFNNQGWGIIPAALEQAAVAAAHIAGSETAEPYAGTTMSNTLKILDFDLMSTGKVAFDSPEEDCKVFISKDEARGIYKKFVTRQGKLIGAILLESKKDQRKVKQLMDKAISDEEIDAMLEIGDEQ